MDPRQPVNPVFYDPKQRRWPLVRGGFFILALAFSIIFGLLIISVLIYYPVLPKDQSRERKSFPTPPAEDPESRPRPVQADGKTVKIAPRPVAKPLPKQTPSAGAPRTVAYFVNWSEHSMESLRQHLDQIDVLIPEWLHVSVNGAAVTLVEDNAGRRKEVMELVKPRGAALQVVPLVNNCQGKIWEGTQLGEVISTRAGRAKVIEALSKWLRENKFTAVSVDFEEIPAKLMPAYHQFLTELGLILAVDRIALWVNVPLNNDNYNYRQLGKDSDYVLLMGYDQHWSTGTAGAIAGQDWFTKALAARAAEIPAKKMVVVIGNYGLDWPAAGGEAQSLRFYKAMELASKANALPAAGGAEMNPHFTYADDGGRGRQVWMLDAVSGFNQCATARKAGVYGIGLYRLGSEDPGLWTFFGRAEMPSAKEAAALRDVPPERATPDDKDEEIHGVVQKAVRGERQIEIDAKTGLITSARIQTCPISAVGISITNAGRKVALTFDDGPDPDYTPAILDTLKSEGVPATFFVMGMKGQENPRILRREFNEGHEIGNHTFWHRSMDTVSLRELNTDLALTQRLFESVFGRRTVLFRPPYGVDDISSKPNPEFDVLKVLGEWEYITVGMHIDPRDWEQPGVDEIVRSTIEQVERGDGHVILLHDAGGERAQTVEALPRIIRELRARGYEFVRVSDLIGRTRDGVMPPAAARDLLMAWMNRVAFGVLNALLTALSALFIIGTFLGTARLAVIGMLAIIEHRRERRATYQAGYSPSVAVIVPAYN
jgi:peptidoglycan-N-acetylglucosamine deacetylase